ncbi:MAG TPA: hypothetical protein P5181_12300 [Dermatophilaceae bacterium]|nr:hypothetical protein [Dermatophilaceae bacterium]
MTSRAAASDEPGSKVVVRRHRAPRPLSFVLVGTVLGFAAGGALALVGQPVKGYSAGAQVGYFGLLGAFLGALIGGIIFALLDRRSS